MSSSVNRVIIVGTLGGDPIIRKTNAGKSYANFSIATNKKWKNGNGEKQEKTTWHNILVWEGLTKICGYLTKGSQIYLEGELSYSVYNNKDGIDIKKTEIIASLINILKIKRNDDSKIESAATPAINIEDDEIPF